MSRWGGADGANYSVVRQVEHILLRMNPLNVTPPKGARVLSWDVNDLSSAGIQVGDYATKYGMTFKWTENHWTGQKLEKRRYIGDDLCENCLEELDVKPEDDALIHQPFGPHITHQPFEPHNTQHARQTSQHVVTYSLSPITTKSLSALITLTLTSALDFYPPSTEHLKLTPHFHTTS